ncbi:MAG: hypothetical protein Q9163_001856 [Psora crenata]
MLDSGRATPQADWCLWSSKLVRYLLLGAAISMGAVAIWSMHFIGNRAIVMADDQDELQIQYSSGFTAGSFFLPICGVGIAFYFFSVSESISTVTTIVGGLLMGSAVCGMHYMGEGGLANYTASYTWPWVLGSAIIAVVASTTSLGIFFYFKSVWTNTWQKRGASASLLAVAVSGMHWVAVRGTRYRLKSDVVTGSTGLSRQAVVIVVICLAIGACLALIALAMIGQRARKESADRAQQVVLACATFDMEGRLMVTSAGLLPCRKITNIYLERSFDDVFDTNHAVFCWVFRASRCWRAITDLLPAIREHVRISESAKAYRAAAFSTSSARNSESSDDYACVFKELFCIAASELATTVQEPLEKLGIIFEEIMSTGTLKQSNSIRSMLPGSRAGEQDNAQVERGHTPILLGRGQLLFAVRQASKSESLHLQAAGYCFTNPTNVIDSLARSMQVSQEEIASRLKRMQDYVSQERILEPGIHLACFALRPLLKRGFDILVTKDARNILPSVSLPLTKLEPWQVEILAQMDASTVTSCRQRLSGQSLFTNEEERHFVRQLFEGIKALADLIDNPFFEDARLIARPFRSPCRLDGNKSGEAFIIAFTIITDAHELSNVNQRYEFAPLRFYICQQHTYRDTPDIDRFAERIRREFAAIADRGRKYTEQKSKDLKRQASFINGRRRSKNRTSSPPRGRKWSHFRKFSCGALSIDNSSEKHLVNVSMSQRFDCTDTSPEANADLERPCASPEEVEMRNWGVYCQAGLGDVEEESFAEKLLALTIGRRKGKQ